MKMTIAQIQATAGKLFKTVAELLEEESIPYVGFYGTMLGAVRHQGPIPWDPDIDIVIPEPEMERFLEVMRRRLPAEYWLDYGTTDDPQRAIPRVGLSGYETRELHIDVFPMSGFPKQRWKRLLMNKFGTTLISIRCAKVYTYQGKKKYLAALVRALTCLTPAESFAKMYQRLCRHYPYGSAELIGDAADHDGANRIYTKEIFDSVAMPYADFKIRIPKNYDALLRMMYGEYMQFPPEAERTAAIQKLYEIRELP